MPQRVEARSEERFECADQQRARWYITSVTQPRVIQLRRLVIAEALRFPELGRSYYERAPGQSIDALAKCFARLAERGLVQVDESLLAAYHFACLVLTIPLDPALLLAEDEGFTPAELQHFADAAVRVFLAAYGPAKIDVAVS